MKEIMKKYNKFLHTIEACWLCLRFPFLYPRNRFTGRNRKNVLHNLVSWAYKKGIYDISVTARLEKDYKKPTMIEDNKFFDFVDHVSYKLDKENKKLIVYNKVETIEHDLKSILWKDDKFEILGMTVSCASYRNPVIIIKVKTKDETDTTNYGFHYENIKLTISKFYRGLYKVINWIDSEILDRILFIPTFTELDAMEPGWRKAFGIQMCKEIKAQLKKDHYLYQYRIAQIKEKFGYLHWYDEGSSREVQDIISKYEDISWNTCLVCGKPATKITSGWISPYCDDCFPKNHVVYQEKIDGVWRDTKEHKELMKKIEEEK